MTATWTLLKSPAWQALMEITKQQPISNAASICMSRHKTRFSLTSCLCCCALRALPLAEGQGGEVFVDGGQQGLGSGQAQGHMPHPKVLHVVAGLQVLMHKALACAVHRKGDW